LTVLMTNRTIKENWIKFDLNPYSGDGFVTGKTAEGQIITYPTTASTVWNMITSGYMSAGIHVVDAIKRVAIVVRFINSSGQIELTFISPNADEIPAQFNVQVDWWLH
jgi:hypothetical protein